MKVCYHVCVASTRQLSTLFTALSDGDLARARTIAETISDGEDERGHGVAARQLRSALRRNGTSLVKPAPGGPAGLPDALTALEPVPFDAVELPAATRAMFERIIREHRVRAGLAAHGLEPRARILLHGPPGTGKSFTARALAGALGLPVFVVRLDAIVGSYLGQTGSRLHEVFRFAEHHAAVLFLDELDALGRHRGRGLDVGELDRVVVSLMQELDYARIRGLVVGATNFPRGLDDALWRRFEVVVALPRPSQRALARFVRRRRTELGVTSPEAPMIAQIPKAATYADAERVVIDTLRDEVVARLAHGDE